MRKKEGTNVSKRQKDPKQPPDITWIEKRQTLSAEETPVLNYEIKLPQLTGKTAAVSRIDRCYEKTARVWEQRWKERVFPLAEQAYRGNDGTRRPFSAWHTWVRGEIAQMDAEFLSVRVEAGEVRDSGKPCLMRWGEIWDLRSGTPCPAGNFFSERWKWKRGVLAQVLEQGKARRIAGDCFLDRDWEGKIGKMLLWREPCLTQQGMEFYLPQCALTPAAEGVPVFSVPVKAERSQS